MIHTFNTDFIEKEKNREAFSDKLSQDIFCEWCKVNDWIVPVFVSREKWEALKPVSILVTKNQNTKNLFLPKDLHPWEMANIIKTLDTDTFWRKSDIVNQRKDQIIKLWKTFQKAWLYLQEYLPHIEEWKEIAKTISQEFYNYGLLLENQTHIWKEIPDTSLSKDDKHNVDEWFLGSIAYNTRIKRLSNNTSQDLPKKLYTWFFHHTSDKKTTPTSQNTPPEKQIEKRRKQIIRNYFKALSRKSFEDEWENPWELKKWPAKNIQDKTNIRIFRTMRTPEIELKTALFRRWVEKLIIGMKESVEMYEKRKWKNVSNWRKNIYNFLDNFGVNLLKWRETLYNSLNISHLKTELEDLKKSWNIDVISQKEIEIAKQIQKAVSSFRYKSLSNNPSKMLKTGVINCLWASTLGWGLLDELGIKYLHSHIPKHSLTFLITSNKKVYWQDLTPNGPSNDANYHEVKDDDIWGKNLFGKKITVQDIVDLTDMPKDLKLNFKMEKKWKRNYGENINVIATRSELSLPSFILSNINSKGKKEKDIKYSQESILAHPWNPSGYYNIWIKQKYSEGIKILKQAFIENQNFHYLLAKIWDMFSTLWYHDKVIKINKKIALDDPEHIYSYSKMWDAFKKIGKDNEALEAYEKFYQIYEKYNHNNKDVKKEAKRIKKIISKMKRKKKMVRRWSSFRSFLKKITFRK